MTCKSLMVGKYPRHHPPCHRPPLRDKSSTLRRRVCHLDWVLGRVVGAIWRVHPPKLQLVIGCPPMNQIRRQDVSLRVLSVTRKLPSTAAHGVILSRARWLVARYTKQEEEGKHRLRRPTPLLLFAMESVIVRISVP